MRYHIQIREYYNTRNSGDTLSHRAVSPRQSTANTVLQLLYYNMRAVGGLIYFCIEIYFCGSLESPEHDIKLLITPHEVVHYDPPVPAYVENFCKGAKPFNPCSVYHYAWL